MNSILIIGAASAIAKAFAEQVRDSKKLFLVDFDKDKLEAVEKDLIIRKNNKIKSFVLNVNEHDKIDEMFKSATQFLGVVDTILIAHGTLPNQEKCNSDINTSIQEFTTNGTSTIALCQKAANILEPQKSGSLIVITSVAGDRGRQSNYLYGAAKGAVSICLQGLRNRVANLGITVITIKPGFVDTPMTAHLPKNPLFSSPEKIANGILKAAQKGKNTEIYLPSYWRLIMFIIKLIPVKIFNKLSL
jgi:short-subunit dehydrogenase